ncbi:hypothetical protein CPLU01_03832 [Colletotrichum plurivorum]|uniref:Uncharacterized protein n=1 Tax=Colletotrichum plurivorum TaxID=2175906 RepID=A0A8H6NKH3_9PEZI|nr:hypothetical protein CPLU01_03832 [Colletotrichum plurivorum]
MSRVWKRIRISNCHLSCRLFSFSVQRSARSALVCFGDRLHGKRYQACRHWPTRPAVAEMIPTLLRVKFKDPVAARPIHCASIRLRLARLSVCVPMTGIEVEVLDGLRGTPERTERHEMVEKSKRAAPLSTSASGQGQAGPLVGLGPPLGHLVQEPVLNATLNGW